jgi:hypothetical protein
MAIVRPVTKTVISTTEFGIPVVDAINNFDPHIVAKVSAMVGGAITAGVWTNAPGISVTFTPKANWCYEFKFGTCLVGGAAGSWWAVTLTNLPGGANPWTRALAFSTNYYNWGHTVDASGFCNGTLAATPITVQMQANVSGANGTFNNGQESYIYVINHGPKV